MAQWWERSPLASVLEFDSSLVPHVGWVCCWFSSLLKGLFSGFPASTKTNISKFQFDQDKGPAWKPAKADVASFLGIII